MVLPKQGPPRLPHCVLFFFPRQQNSCSKHSGFLGHCNDKHRKAEKIKNIHRAFQIGAIRCKLGEARALEQVTPHP